MSFPRERIVSGDLAGAFAKKFFGKFGFCRMQKLTITGGNIVSLFEVGVCHDGDFVVKGASGYDYAEAFQLAGKYMDTNDPIYLRATLKKAAKAFEEPIIEQLEMFA